MSPKPYERISTLQLSHGRPFCSCAKQQSCLLTCRRVHADDGNITTVYLASFAAADARTHAQLRNSISRIRGQNYDDIAAIPHQTSRCGVDANWRLYATTRCINDASRRADGARRVCMRSLCVRRCVNSHIITI